MKSVILELVKFAEMFYTLVFTQLSGQAGVCSIAYSAYTHDGRPRALVTGRELFACGRWRSPSPNTVVIIRQYLHENKGLITTGIKLAI